MGVSAVGEKLPASAEADAWMGTGNDRAKKGEGKGKAVEDLAIAPERRNDTCSGPGKRWEFTDICPTVLACCS